MKVIDTIINYSESLKGKTIFEVLDDCINSAENLSGASINVNWFIELKLKIEEDLKEYAREHFIAPKYLLNNNRVVKTENGLKITNRSQDFTYLEIYFPSEFNPNYLIIRRNFY